MTGSPVPPNSSESIIPSVPPSQTLPSVPVSSSSRISPSTLSGASSSQAQSGRTQNVGTGISESSRTVARPPIALEKAREKCLELIRDFEARKISKVQANLRIQTALKPVLGPPEQLSVFGIYFKLLNVAN
ncbi:hypothetical protein VKT23_009800, partial [Stygiomarasmius scandens]